MSNNDDEEGEDEKFEELNNNKYEFLNAPILLEDFRNNYLSSLYFCAKNILVKSLINTLVFFIYCSIILLVIYSSKLNLLLELQVYLM